MRVLISSLAAAAIAAMLFLPLGTPARAQERSFTADVTQVQYRHGDRWDRGHRWRDRHHGGRHHWRHGRHWRHRDHGLSFGIIIAPPPIYHPRPRYVPRHHYGRDYYGHRRGGGHVEWCYARYRSYRAYDNTYQPYHGHRRPCYSPYN